MDKTKENLPKILEAHRLWLKSAGKEGTQADLRGADLRGDYLEGANLKGAIYNLKTIWPEGFDVEGSGAVRIGGNQ